MEYIFNNFFSITSKTAKISFSLLTKNAIIRGIKNYEKYVKLAVFCLTLMLCSGTYCGWQFLVTLFEEKRVYYWLCDDQYDSEGCSDQQEALQFLFTVALSANYFMNPVAAILFEIVGPKFTAALGSTLLITGYYLLSISNQTVDLYIPAMLLIGACTDFLAYAAFSISPLFPYPTLISGLLLGFSCMSWWIPVIFTVASTYLSWSLFYIFVTYATVVLVPACVLYVLFVPRYTYNTKSKEVKGQFFEAMIDADKSTIAGSDSENSQVVGFSVFDANSSTDADLTKSVSERSYKERNEFIHSESSDESPTDVEENSHSGINIGHYNFTPNEFMITKHDNFTKDTISLKSYIENLNKQNIPKTERLKNIIKELLNHPILPVLKSYQHLALVCFWSISIFRFAFYFSSINVILGDNYTIVLGYISPLCCFFYPTYGYLIDAIGFYRAIHIINFVNTSMYIFSILAIIFPQVAILSWISIILYPASYGPYIFLLAYTKSRWGHIKNYIAIVGFDFIIAGIVSLLTTVFYKLVMDHFGGNFLPVYCLVTLLCILLFPLFWLMKKLEPSNF